MTSPSYMCGNDIRRKKTKEEQSIQALRETLNKHFATTSQPGEDEPVDVVDRDEQEEGNLLDHEPVDVVDRDEQEEGNLLDNEPVDVVDRDEACINLSNLIQAVADANTAIQLDLSMAKAYLCKGTALLKLEEFRTAKSVLQVGASLAPGDTRFSQLIKECAQGITEETGELPNQFAAPAEPKYRYDYYQVRDKVVLVLSAERVPAKHVVVDFGEKLLTVTIEIPGEDVYYFQLGLFAKIKPQYCKYQVFSTEIQIHLVKAEPIHWTSLGFTRELCVVPKKKKASTVAENLAAAASHYSDYHYVSEILRASSCFSEDTDVFRLLEKQHHRTNSSTLHRKLVFDIITEILNMKTQLPPWKASSITKCTTDTSQLQQIWTEFQRIQQKDPAEDSFEVIGEVIRKDMADDYLGGWSDATMQMPDAVLDIERMIFKDLVVETIPGPLFAAKRKKEEKEERLDGDADEDERRAKSESFVEPSKTIFRGTVPQKLKRMNEQSMQRSKAKQPVAAPAKPKYRRIPKKNIKAYTAVVDYRRSTYPSSKSKSKNRDEIEAQVKKEEREEKLDGHADEDERRAKSKSFFQVRSNASLYSVEMLMRELPFEKPKRYSFDELATFTSNFDNEIGSGAFGNVYKGQFSDGTQVAVKVLKMHDVVHHSFLTEIRTMGKTGHQNLIKLIGFCLEENMLALVYEYMENGSLDKILYKKPLTLEWDKLYAIAVELANALAYLHHDCGDQIIHHDIKASNVLLDSNHLPKLSDFGLANLKDMERTHLTLTKCRGTPGYAAPEIWTPFSPITSKCDVYSFGMILFEILGTEKNNRTDIWFPRHVWEKFNSGTLDDLITKCGISENDRKKAMVLSLVALWCAQHTPQTRPSMSTVATVLKNEILVKRPPNPFLTSDSSDPMQPA